MNRGSKWYQSRENKRPRRQCYQPLQNVEDDEKYVNQFVDGTDSSNELTSFRPNHYMEKIVEPGDSLQTLSLQFNCPVAELKRINHILRDNEIFARRSIKVPVKPGSVVTEKLARVHSNGVKNDGYNESANVTSTDDENENIEASNSTFTQSTQLLQGSIQLAQFRTSNEIVNCKSVPNTSFTSDENTLLQIENSTVSSLQNDEREIRLLTNSENQIFKCSGADWGLSWLQLVICSLLLGVAGPLFYIFYLTEKKHSS